MRLPAVLPLVVLIMLLLASTADVLAGDDGHDRRAAVAAGQRVPLRLLLDRLEADYLGEVIEVELEDDDGRDIYEIDWLTPAGDKLEFEFDAVSGRLLDIEGQGAERARRR